MTDGENKSQQTTHMQIHEVKHFVTISNILFIENKI